ncbi:MAG: glycoside hydrolase family 15 protein, partial [Acidobacteriota bacterium]
SHGSVLQHDLHAHVQQQLDVLEEFGQMRVVDGMPIRKTSPDLVRIIQGVEGEVRMRMELIIRFDYGAIVPWVRTIDGVLRAVGGADAIALWSPVPLRGTGLTTTAEFAVRQGDELPFVMAWHPAYAPVPAPIDARQSLDDTEQWWHEWSARSTYTGPWREAVMRSLITLKALTFAPSGGIVAAPTTSLPELIGGVRNWDYRYCWIRDATFTLYALLGAGYIDEAAAWRTWLLRTVAGDPAALQILYGPTGERRLPELTLDWVPGYEGSRPVRVGNAAVGQRQLDIYGELMDAMYLARRTGLAPDHDAWTLEKALLQFVSNAWHEPDEGIWEVRGPRRQFTHSKVMAWVAVDRAIKTTEHFGLDGPVEQWRTLRRAIHADVCRHGFNSQRGAFTQFYGSSELDASLLMLPLVGFLPPNDPRVTSTVGAIERELMTDGFVQRYRMVSSTSELDGLPAGEGVFLPCSFWLADTYALMGRRAEAEQLFEKLLALRNDLGLLAEEYDPQAQRLLGNFPQAFSHVSLVNTALNMTEDAGPAEHRRGGPGA